MDDLGLFYYFPKNSSLKATNKPDRAYTLSDLSAIFFAVSFNTLTLGDEKFLKKLGAKIRMARLARGWTLEQAEEHGWPSWQHLQKVESGKNITVVTLRRVCALYKTSLSDLFNGV